MVADLPSVTNLANMDVACTSNSPLEELLINAGAHKLADELRPIRTGPGRPREYEVERKYRRRKIYKIVTSKIHYNLMKEDEEELLKNP